MAEQSDWRERGRKGGGFPFDTAVPGEEARAGYLSKPGMCPSPKKLHAKWGRSGGHHHLKWKFYFWVNGKQCIRNILPESGLHMQVSNPTNKTPFTLATLELL